MSRYNYTANDIKLFSGRGNLYVKYKVQLINQSNDIIEELQGDLISGNLSIDSESDIRRTASINLSVDKKKYNISNVLIIYKLKLLVGISKSKNGTKKWYSLGLYNFSTQNFTYDEENNICSFSLNDMMSKLVNSPIRNSENLTISHDQNIRESMIGIISRYGGFNSYIIDDICPTYDNTANTVPYELKYSNGTASYEVVKELRDLYAGWETYCDEDVFVCDRIPTCEGDTVIINDDVINSVGGIISESNDINLDEIKNCTEIWGKDIDAKHYTTNCTLVDDTYNVTFDGWKGFTTDLYLAIKIPTTNPSNAKLKINNQAAYNILQYTYANGSQTEDNLEANRLTAGCTYVFRYNTHRFYYLGQYKVHGISVLVDSEPNDEQKANNITNWNCNAINYIVDPTSPYTVDKIGEKWDVQSYEQLYSDDLALEQAKFNNWKSSRLKNQLTIEMMWLPFLDVNEKISYTPRTDNPDNITYDWIIKQITPNLDNFTMSVTLMRFYEAYPDIITQD